VTVAQNLKLFPDTALAAHGIKARHPDEFLVRQFSLERDTFGMLSPSQRRSV